jgi:ABC-type sugar transport system ATPase subunit
LIEAAGVTKRYGQVTALDDVSAVVTSPARLHFSVLGNL